jgi:uncharacterized BrkB/YihY/UPF0761 family membrane protein
LDSKTIDEAIDALSEAEHESLCDAAAQSWQFRVLRWVIPLAVLASGFFLFFAARDFLHAYWPKSVPAATVATVLWLVAFVGLMRLALSIRVTHWFLRRAMRRAFRARRGVA